MTSKDLLGIVYSSIQPREGNDLLSPQRIELIENILVKAFNIGLAVAANKVELDLTGNYKGCEISKDSILNNQIIDLDQL